MQVNKKRVVLITTWFPPRQSVAVNRMLAISKYLNKDKYDLSVITLGEEGEQEFEEVNGTKVYRTISKSLFDLPKFNSTDGFIKHKLKVVKKLFLLKFFKSPLENWKKKSLDKLITLHKKTPFDLVISSYAPADAHELALPFIKQFPVVKWIADMRDEMSQNKHVNDKEKNRLTKLEQEVNVYASAVTTVSYPIVDYFKPLLPNITCIEEIKNGFDHGILPNRNTFNEVLTFTYAGSFYGQRKPTTFFKALLACKANLPQHWKIRFIGTSRNFTIPKEFEENVEFISRVPQQQSLVYMSESDVNLIIHPSERKGIYTGKLFDYLSVYKPVLGLIDKDDVAADLIRETNGGFVASFENHEEIVKAIVACIDLWKNKKELNYNNTIIEGLHRKYQVKKLETVIDSVLNEKI